MSIKSEHIIQAALMWVGAIQGGEFGNQHCAVAYRPGNRGELSKDINAQLSCNRTHLRGSKVFER